MPFIQLRISSVEQMKDGKWLRSRFRLRCAKPWQGEFFWMAALQNNRGDRLDRRNLLRSSGMGELALGALAGGDTMLSGVRPAEATRYDQVIPTLP